MAWLAQDIYLNIVKIFDLNYILAEHLFNSTAKTATCESQCLQGLAKSWSPVCANVAGKTRQKW